MYIQYCISEKNKKIKTKPDHFLTIILFSSAIAVGLPVTHRVTKCRLSCLQRKDKCVNTPVFTFKILQNRCLRQISSNLNYCVKFIVSSLLFRLSTEHRALKISIS